MTPSKMPKECNGMMLLKKDRNEPDREFVEKLWNIGVFSLNEPESQTLEKINENEREKHRAYSRKSYQRRRTKILAQLKEQRAAKKAQKRQDDGTFEPVSEVKKGES